MTKSRLLRGIIRSARPANIPTLLTNAAVAWVAVHGAIMPPAGLFTGVFFMGLAFYLYGMWENDRVDARWDAAHYPDRPVPSGAVSVFTLRALGALSALTGLTLNVTLGGGLIDAAVLVFVIALYNMLHKAWGGAFILMGACRALWALCAGVVFTAINGGEAFAMPHVLVWYAVSLGVFTCVISIVARREATRPELRPVVGWLLSGMCLFDAVWLGVMGSQLAVAAGVLWLLIRVLQMRGVRST